jgi:hypothetical protein
MSHVVYSTMNLEDWKRWILRWLDREGHYWTMEKTPLPLREQAVDELATAGELVKRAVMPAHGYQEWVSA